ncbi:EamA family transporter [Micromonospora sp. NPDC049114]|uniref:EamA family transporter n=2 Tax=unclassified Micromonospora TaxID=2617518 RepID=UPI0033C5F1BE
MGGEEITMKPTHVGLVVFVAAVWGVNFVVIDVGLQDFPPLLFSALRFILAAIPAVFFVGSPRVAWRWVLIVGIVLGVLKFSFLFIGMHVGMPAGLASLVLQSQAAFTIVLATLLLRERPRAVQLVGLGVAMAGIVLVGTRLGGTTPVAGFLLVLAAAACWGLANIATRKANPPDMFRFMVWVSVVPPLPLLILSAVFEGVQDDLAALRSMSVSGVVAAVYVAWVATLLGYAIWGYLIRIHGATSVAPYALLIPVFGLGAAAVFQGEPLTAVTILASVLVISGVAVGAVRLPRSASSEAIVPVGGTDDAVPVLTARRLP